MPDAASPQPAHAKPSLRSRLAMLAVSGLVAGLLAELTLRRREDLARQQILAAHDLDEARQPLPDFFLQLVEQDKRARGLGHGRVQLGPDGRHVGGEVHERHLEEGRRAQR